jgi:hypothetical protein
MQLLPEQFYSLTWGQYNCRVRGWLRLEEEKWEHTRSLYALLYNTNVDKKDQKPKEKLIPLRKDRRNMLLQVKKPTISREELIARIKKRDNLN